MPVSASQRAARGQHHEHRDGDEEEQLDHASENIQWSVGHIRFLLGHQLKCEYPIWLCTQQTKGRTPNRLIPARFCEPWETVMAGMRHFVTCRTSFRYRGNRIETTQNRVVLAKLSLEIIIGRQALIFPRKSPAQDAKDDRSSRARSRQSAMGRRTL